MFRSLFLVNIQYIILTNELAKRALVLDDEQ